MKWMCLKISIIMMLSLVIVCSDYVVCVLLKFVSRKLLDSRIMIMVFDI